MLFEQCNDRLFQLLCYVGYSIEFPKFLASRIGGHPDWCRHVMYRAIKEGYVDVYRRETAKRVITSLRITEKGLEYVAVRSPEVYMLIQARIEDVPRGTHSALDRVLRYQSFASAMVMAHNAGAMVLSDDKPPLTLREYEKCGIQIDPNICYFYSTLELRAAIQEYAPEIAAKGSRIVGILVHGNDCFCIYNAGRTRIYWMRSTEENFAATVQTLLNVRGFRIRVLRQVMLGDKMNLAAKLCRRRVYKGTKYFVLSNFFNNCYFVTNDANGERQLRSLWDADTAQIYNQRALINCRPPDRLTREYDAIDMEEGRPVILNYMCDLLILPGIDYAPEGFDDSPIIKCFDHQVPALQQLVGSLAEVRGIGGTEIG